MCVCMFKHFQALPFTHFFSISSCLCTLTRVPAHAHPAPCTLPPSLGFGDFLAIPQKGSISSLPASRCSSDGIWLAGPPLLPLRPGRFAGHDPAQFLLEQLLPQPPAPLCPWGSMGCLRERGARAWLGLLPHHLVVLQVHRLGRQA